MKKYNLEDLLSVLFVMGFNQADDKLCIALLNKISSDENKHQLQFYTQEFSEEFNRLIDFDGTTYRLKNQVIYYNEQFGERLHGVRQELMNYLCELDLREIVILKLNWIMTKSKSNFIDDLAYMFSNVEKYVIHQMFGLQDMEEDYSERQIQQMNQQRLFQKYVEVEEQSCRKAAEIVRNCGTREEIIEKYDELFRSLDKK